MGAALTAFTDFYTHATGPAYMSGPEKIINDAMLRDTRAFDALSRAKMKVQGGKTINEKIFLTDQGLAETYRPGDTATVTGVNGLSTITAPWRSIRAQVSWTEAEILLNEGGGRGDGGFHQFVALKDAKHQMAYTSLMNLLEKKMLATASNSTMEAAAGKEPYSIRAAITTDGLAPSGFTTVHGINPTTESNWRNQNTTYTVASLLDPEDGLLGGFDTVTGLCDFQAPSVSPDGAKFTESNLKNNVILTNREGLVNYKKALRATNDFSRAAANDPSYNTPVWDGAAVKQSAGIDDQSVFSAGSPGYYFINGDYFSVVYHTEKWFDRQGPFTPFNQPDTIVFYYDIYLNIVCTSRRRQAILTAA